MKHSRHTLGGRAGQATCGAISRAVALRIQCLATPFSLPR